METTTQTAEPSIADLRAMLDPSTPEKEPKPASEPEAAKPEENTTQTDPEPVEVKQPEEVEEELPEGVRKRIAKEVQREARIRLEIDKAVSARKATEAELAKLNGNQGSEPVKQTELKSGARPELPDPDTFQGTIAEFKAAMRKYSEEYSTWMESQTRETVTRELTERQQREASEKQRKEAIAKHGADFEAHIDTVRASASEQMQLAISALDQWDDVAVHLAKHPDELTALAAKFDANPVAAIAELGKLEARLTPAADTKPKAEKPLPTPLKPHAGSAADPGKLDLEKVPMSVFKKEMQKLGLK